MSENINPLLDFARVVECSVKLPSNGSWYDDDNITFNSIGEVDIKAMLPRDELLMSNPETLISGETVIQVIRSCCPGIKRPEDLYYPDVNALLLGIHKATYGNEIKVNGFCPACDDKKMDNYNELLQKNIKIEIDEKIKNGKIGELTQKELELIEEKTETENDINTQKLEEENEIMTSIQTNIFDIDWILSKMSFLPNEKIIESDNGLKIYLTPYKCKDKIYFTVKNIHDKKHMNNLYDKMKDLNNEDVKQQEELSQEIAKSYDEILKETMEILSRCISKIVIPSGIVVDNKEHIKEFVLNSDVEIIKHISSIVDELTECGIPSVLPFKCQCCGHEWEEKFHGYNPSDFFGNRS